MSQLTESVTGEHATLDCIDVEGVGFNTEIVTLKVGKWAAIGCATCRAAVTSDRNQGGYENTGLPSLAFCTRRLKESVPNGTNGHVA